MIFIPIQLRRLAVQQIGHAPESIRDCWVPLRQRTQFSGASSQEIGLIYHSIG